MVKYHLPASCSHLMINSDWRSRRLMSTRGFVTLVIDGQEKTIFNHFDSCPDALGQSVLSWLRDSAVNCITVTEQRVRALRLLPCRTDIEIDYADEEVRAQRAVYDIQRDVHRLLTVGVAVDDSEFPLDSLWAEWGYVIDFDTRRLEVYTGFQKTQHDRGRFAGRMMQPPHRHKVYYPVALVLSWPFSALPTNGQFMTEISILTGDDSE